MSPTSSSAVPRPVEGGGGVSREGAARAVVRAGRFLSVSLVIGAAVQGAFGEGTFRFGLSWSLAFATAAIALLWLLPPLADRGLVAGALAGELSRGNVAAAIAGAGNRVAVGIVLSHCLYGAGLQTFVVALTFVAIAFASLLVMQWLYRLLTHYSDADEIRDGNVAAALSYAGVTLALGIVVGRATWGDFTDWASSLGHYALALLTALGLYPVRQLVVRRLLLGLPFALRGGALDQAIAQERSAVVGAVEGAAYIATALLVSGIFP